MLIEFSDRIDPSINDQVRLLMTFLTTLPYVTDMIPAFSSLLVQYDPSRISAKRLERTIRRHLKQFHSQSSDSSHRIHLIPVLYDGEDLPFVCTNSGLSKEEVVALHSGRDYLIYMLGFLPGFAYLGGLDEKLHSPRLTTPRTSIPAGSVGIGGEQTGIYPLDSPGGWRLIGRTPLKPYYPSREEPFLYSMGDYIRFIPVSEKEYSDILRQVNNGTYEHIVISENPSGQESSVTTISSDSSSMSVTTKTDSAKSSCRLAENGNLAPELSSFTVLSKGLQMSVQDEGRLGYQSHGFSVSGCMDRRSYHEANRLLGNNLKDAVIEMLFAGGSFEFHGDQQICLTGADMDPKINGRSIPMYQPVSVASGDRLTLSPSKQGRYGYLAVRGGIQVPSVMGSRSTGMKVHLGGFEGRALQVGDPIPCCLLSDLPPVKDIPSRAHPVFSSESPIPIRVLLGSQQERFGSRGIETFFHEIYTVSQQSDRMGYRLEGAPVDAAGGVDIISDGTVFGSIQIPASGKPIVLLSDRQTTGGYAKIGTIIEADLPLFVQCLPGTRIQFIPCSLKEAMKARAQAEPSERKWFHVFH